jgi:hypothetical protein
LINDKVPLNLSFPMVLNIENFLLVLSSMEHRLAQAKKEGGEKSSTDGEEDEEDNEMQRRINIAKLVRTNVCVCSDVTVVVCCCLHFGPTGNAHNSLTYHLVCYRS